MESITTELERFYPARRIEFLSSWELEVLRHVYEKGGFYNAHAHLCRAATLEPAYLEHIGTTPLEASSFPLSVKQDLVGNLHTGVAYTRENLMERMSREIERQIAYGTKRIDTNIDATPDLSEDGLLAVNVALELKKKYADRIAIRIAPTPIFGLREGTHRWEVFKAAALLSDYLSGLPEKDDYAKSMDRKGKVGFRSAVRMVLELGYELGKEVQFHLDQANDPHERGTEILLEGLRWFNQFTMARPRPEVWIIHMISPSAYNEERYTLLIDELKEQKVGVIICPSAAISMRQLRPVVAPTHNSMARVAELIKAEVPLRIGSDNVCDVFVPPSEGDILTELKFAAHAVRLSTPSIWAKIATGTPLNNVDVASVGRALYEDRKAFLSVDPTWRSTLM